MSASENKSSEKSSFACFCQRVTIQQVEDWSRSAKIKNLAALQDATGAGCGPCGGSCRPLLMQILDSAKNTPSSSAKPPIPQEFLQAISLFNRRYYWETHEVLENLWLEEVGATKTFYQALIQGAAALYHVLNANPRGVIKLSQDSLAKIKGPQDNPWEIDLTPLIYALNSYKTQAEEILGNTRSGFDYASLPKLQLDEQLNVSI